MGSVKGLSLEETDVIGNLGTDDSDFILVGLAVPCNSAVVSLTQIFARDTAVRRIGHGQIDVDVVDFAAIFSDSRQTNEFVPIAAKQGLEFGFQQNFVRDFSVNAVTYVTNVLDTGQGHVVEEYSQLLCERSVG